jgi:hypothetical protein
LQGELSILQGKNQFLAEQDSLSKIIIFIGEKFKCKYKLQGLQAKNQDCSEFNIYKLEYK